MSRQGWQCLRPAAAELACVVFVTIELKKLLVNFSRIDFQTLAQEIDLNLDSLLLVP